MGLSVAINPPKTPVTKGSRGKAKNTIPNVCKMPGPPAPFVPTPLPNIGKSGNSPKDYSKDVTIERNAVAIQARPSSRWAMSPVRARAAARCRPTSRARPASSAPAPST